MATAFGQIRLGDAVYHMETESLITASGDEVILRSQSATVLRHLATHLGKLMTRDELVLKVWPDTAVTDDSLTQCISDIRKAMGDHKRAILKTVSKRGYILRGEHLGDTPDSAPSNSALPLNTSTAAPLSESEAISAAKRPFRKIALGITGFTETRQALMKRLPDALQPESILPNTGENLILIYPEAELSLQAAMLIGGAGSLTMAVEYTNGDGREVATLLEVAAAGDILTSPDIFASVAAGEAFDFHDLGEITTPSGLDRLRPFRVTTRGTQHAIAPQLDARDVLPTLAILPFRTGAQEPDTMLGTFLADEIATSVGRSQDLNVISRLSTGVVGRSNGDLRSIGRLLNADFVLSGSLFQNGTRAIAIVEFAEAETQYVLWSERMEVAIDPQLSEIEGVDQIVAKIRKAISKHEMQRVRSRPLESLKLYSVLHGAVGLMHRLSLKEFQLARTYLEYVISKAPNHPTPLAWLARWHVLKAVQGWSQDAKQEAQEALELTARALDIDPDNTLALLCEGQVLANMAYRLDEAKMRYDAALDNNPNDAQGRALRGMLASFQDRGVEGKRDAERALHLTPLDPHRFMFLALAAGANIAAHDYARAVDLAKESLRLNRTHVSTLRTLAVAQVGAGQDDDARDTATEILQLQPDLRVSHWLKNSPGSKYKLAQSAAEKLRSIGIPD